MPTAMEVLGAEFGTPRKAANEAEAVTRDSPVHAARRARVARHGTLVLRVNETQEEVAIAEEADEGKVPPDTREEPHRRAKSGSRNAPSTDGAQECLAAEQRRITPALNGNDKDKPPPTEWRDQSDRQGQARATVSRLVAALGRRIRVQRRNVRAERG